MPSRSATLTLFQGLAQAGIVVGCSVGAASAQSGLPVPLKYDMRPLASRQIVEDIQRCVGPNVSLEKVQAFVAAGLDDDSIDGANARQLTSPHANALAAAGQWACVTKSAEGFPKWPVETLHGLVVPVGVPPAWITAWRLNMLTQVAADGVGRGLIVYQNGDADQVHLIAERHQALHIKISTRLLKAGEYKLEHYPAVLRHAAIKRLVTRSVDNGQGTPSRLAIPPHLLLQPVRDEYVHVAPNDVTKEFHFAGTHWVMPGGQTRLALHPDGSLTWTSTTKTSAASTQTPHRQSWRLFNGVLQISLADGSRYALTLSSDRRSMKGVARRAEPNPQEDEGSEWQWPAEFERQAVPAQKGTRAVQQA